MMSGQTVVGFRDSAYLYYPLFKWIDAQWAAGEVPLWNPDCNFGIPVVGDGTSSVFYPGKLIFCCRFLSYPSRYGIYLAFHIPLAAFGAYWFARTLKANQAGAALAAFSYSFGGSVLFQVTNVVYLVSAAWLPFSLCCVWNMVKTGQSKWAVGGGVSCALMILGGDPQMVYHVGLIAVATIFFEFMRRRKRCRRNSRRSSFSGLAWTTGAVSRLALMVSVTSLLSLIQLLPTYEWSKLSERTNPASSVNVYSVCRRVSAAVDKFDVRKYPPDVVPGSDVNFDDHLESSPGRHIQTHVFAELVSLVEPPPDGSIQDHCYQFSQPPWSIAEMIWPNVSGKLFPTYRRWTDAFPGAERIWVPSIYAGLLTVWIAIGGVRLWGRKRRNVWLTRVGLFFAIASLGWYGPIWLMNECLPTNNQIKEIGSQVGGFYWAMVVLLPKYFAFRYPAKLFVIASLCLSLLAGVQIRSQRFEYLRTSNILFALVTLLGFGALTLGPIQEFSSRVAPDMLFGPFDRTGCVRDLAFSLGQSFAVLFVAVAAYQFFSKRGVSAAATSIFIVALTAVDLTIANRGLLAEVPASTFESDTEKLTALQAELSKRQSVIDRPLAIFRSRSAPFEPRVWARTNSEQRLDEIVLWQRETLFPKHHLAQPVRLMGSFCSIWPSKYEWLMAHLDTNSFSKQEKGTLICDAELIVSENGDDYSIQLVDSKLYLGSKGQFDFHTSHFWIGAWVSGISWVMLSCGVTLILLRQGTKQR